MYPTSISLHHIFIQIPFIFDIVECMGLILCRLTMAFDQSPTPILVIGAECICGLLIYILVKLTPVDICHPT